MYIDPKRPNTAHQRMKRMTSQAKRIAMVVNEMRIGRIMNIRAVTAEREPTTVAKTWKARCEQLRLRPERLRETYPFSIAVFVLFSRFVEVLSIEADDCKGEDKLQEAEHEVDDVHNREARTAAIADAHPGDCGCASKCGGEKRLYSSSINEVVTPAGLRAIELRRICRRLLKLSSHTRCVASSQVLVTDGVIST